jgi:two-component system sensor histidine kinase DctS
LICLALQQSEHAHALINIHDETFRWVNRSFEHRFSGDLESTKTDSFLRRLPTLKSHMVCSKFSQFESRNVECLYLDQSGESCAINANLIRVDDEMFFIKVKDRQHMIAENKRYLEDREQLFSTSRSLGVSEMATTLAHELNQPIGTLSNLIEGMRTRVSEGDELHDALDFATQQTRFASSIINCIRDYTRKKKPVFEDIDVISLISDSLSLLDWELTKHAVLSQVQINLDEESCAFVSGDGVMLQQVFVNLIRNALDALNERNPDHARLNIQVFLERQTVCVAIEDNGCGLGERADQEFFVAFSSTKPNGMGVGLNICRSFIELHHGKIWLEQNQLGGCTAHVNLPLSAANSRALLG